MIVAIVATKHLDFFCFCDATFLLLGAIYHYIVNNYEQ